MLAQAGTLVKLFLLVLDLQEVAPAGSACCYTVVTAQAPDAYVRVRLEHCLLTCMIASCVQPFLFTIGLLSNNKVVRC